MYIHKHKEWPSFSGNKELAGGKLNKVNRAVGYPMGCLSVIGFNDKMSAVVESISHESLQIIVILHSSGRVVPPLGAGRSPTNEFSGEK